MIAFNLFTVEWLRARRKEERGAKVLQKGRDGFLDGLTGAYGIHHDRLKTRQTRDHVERDC
jgi:hypothetical protein